MSVEDPVEALRRSEARFRAAAEGSLDAFYIFEPVRDGGGTVVDFVYLYANQNGLARMRCDTLAGRRLSSVVPLVHIARYMATFVAVLDSGTVVEEEIALDIPGVAVRWTHYQVVRLDDGIAVTSRDISDRKAAEEQLRQAVLDKDSLIKELHHRVKNNLQVIFSLIHLHASHSTEEVVREKMTEVATRVSAIALLHDKLSSASPSASIDVVAYAQSLIASLIDAFGARATLMRVVADAAIVLDVDIATHCGLVLCELITNAMKHAFPTPSARDTITVRLVNAEPFFTLSVEDNGHGFKPGASGQREGLGLELVRILSARLGAVLQTRSDASGTVCTLRFDFIAAR